MVNPAYFQFNPLQQVICGQDLEISPSDMALRRTISAPISIPETFVDSSGFNVISSTLCLPIYLSYTLKFSDKFQT